MLKCKNENKYDNLVVMGEEWDIVVGHLLRGETDHITRAILFF